MYSAFERALCACSLLVLGACSSERPTTATGAGTASLTVCADPNNLPFSNQRGEGFENRIAELVAAELELPLRYEWWPQRRGFTRNTLNSGLCDLIVGVPSGYDFAATTRPYYESSYVFVTRAGSGLDIRSFDDPRLTRLRIGVHAVGDDYASVPPALELAARGMVTNIRGYSIYGAYDLPDPPSRLLEALAEGEIDVAVAWGPLAGYFSQRQVVPLQLFEPAATVSDSGLPMSFAISMAVRRDDAQLLARLDQLLESRADGIHRILTAYGVPIISPGGGQLARASP